MINSVIELAEQLCERLDFAAQQDKKYCVDACIEFENYSWEILRIANNIKDIKERFID